MLFLGQFYVALTFWRNESLMITQYEINLQHAVGELSQVRATPEGGVISAETK